MSAKRAKQSLAEIVAQLEAEPPKPRPKMQPGVIDQDGRLHDRNGARFTLKTEDLTPEEAKQLVASASIVAADSCGCGGNGQGCKTYWLTSKEMSALRQSSPPALERDRDAVAWIDAWEGDAGLLLFLHGNVNWAGQYY